MSVNLIYRITRDTEKLTSNITKQSPLGMREIDGNFVEISRAFDELDSQIDDINIRVAQKADTNTPHFTGSINIPTVSTGSYPLNPVEGSMVFNLSENKLYICTKGGDQPIWTSLNDILGAGSYVKKEGDVMSGKLVAPTAEFQSPITAMRPDGAIDKPLELVATNKWTLEQIDDRINSRIGDEGEKNNIDIGGDIYCNRIFADVDLGVLEDGITN